MCKGGLHEVEPMALLLERPDCFKASWHADVAALQCEDILSCDPSEQELTADSNTSSTSEDTGTCGAATSTRDRTGLRIVTDGGFQLDELLLEQQDNCPSPGLYLPYSQAYTGITPAHRATAVDSMLAAALHLGLHNDSLFTAVAVLDRFLATKPVLLPMLQPTAIACLWVAAKYEQQIVPPVRDFANMVVQAPATYSSSDGVDAQAVLTQQLLVELESEVLVELDFRLAAVVTVKHFKGSLMQQLCYTNKAAAEDPSSSSSSSSAAGSSGSKAAAAIAEPSDTAVTSDDSSARKDASAPPAATAAGAVGMSRWQLDRLFCMTSYLTEVSLLEYRLLDYQPSAVASAAFVYAHILLGLGFTGALPMTGYTLPELSGLLDIFCALHATLSGALRLGRPYNVTSKYRSAAVCGVANIPPVTIPAEQRLGGW